jgi:hypothetical protein
VTALIAALRKLKPRDRATLARSLAQLNLALGASDEPASFLFADERAKSSRPRGRR